MTAAMECFDCEKKARVLLAIAESVAAETDGIAGIDERLYCLNHFGHAHRQLLEKDGAAVHRIEFATELFETWQPERPTVYGDSTPERELEALRSYLKAHPQDDPELHGRLVGVEAALDILQRNRQMSDIIDHWPEPWKRRP